MATIRHIKYIGYSALILLIYFIALYLIESYYTNPNHEVVHVPLAILAMGLMIVSGGFVFLGILLHALNWMFMALHNVLTRRV